MLLITFLHSYIFIKAHTTIQYIKTSLSLISFQMNKLLETTLETKIARYRNQQLGTCL